MAKLIKNHSENLRPTKSIFPSPNTYVKLCIQCNKKMHVIVGVCVCMFCNSQGIYYEQMRPHKSFILDGEISVKGYTLKLPVDKHVNVSSWLLTIVCIKMHLGLRYGDWKQKNLAMQLADCNSFVFFKQAFLNTSF